MGRNHREKGDEAGSNEAGSAKNANNTINFWPAAITARWNAATAEGVKAPRRSISSAAQSFPRFFSLLFFSPQKVVVPGEC
jgi:hypothetical protein